MGNVHRKMAGFSSVLWFLLVPLWAVLSGTSLLLLYHQPFLISEALKDRTQTQRFFDVWNFSFSVVSYIFLVLLFIGFIAVFHVFLVHEIWNSKLP